jgi:CBS domain-containing protein
MKLVKHLLADKPPGFVAVSPDTTVFKALQIMAEKDIGAMPVLDAGKLVGLLSERDYARKVAVLDRSVNDIAVREIMTHKVLCVTPNHSAEECMALMTEKRCRHLPVIEGKELIGILSIGDLVKETITEQQLVIKQLEHYIMS